MNLARFVAPRVGAQLISLAGVFLLVSAFMVGAYVWLGWNEGGPSPTTVALSTGAPSTDPSAVTNDVIAFFQERIERDPVDFISHTKLGETYIRQARETGDISAYERAETALLRALEIRPNHLDASAALATVLFAKHDFSAALLTAEEVYAADPGATQGLAIMGDAHLELGDYQAAGEAYASLASAASGSAVQSRLGHVAVLYGEPDEAVDLLAQAEEAAAKSGRSVEAIAWYRLQLGAIFFNTGDIDGADRWYAAALDVFPSYYPALAGLGRVEAARGNYPDAITLYEQAVAAVPQPAYLAALGDLHALMGDADAAQEQYQTVEFIAELAEINQVVYNRELALFYADHDLETDKAVDLALAELEVRRDIYGFDVAAWALYRDGRSAEAAPFMEQALMLGTQDALLLFHAGMIANDLGDREAARGYLERALDINPHFSVLFEDEASSTLAALSDGATSAKAE